MEIDMKNIPLEISPEYEHLFKIDKHIAEFEALEVDEILLKTNEKAGRLQTGQKVILLDLRFANQNIQKSTSDEKVAVFRQTSGFYLEGASVICHVVSAFYGGVSGGGIGGVFSAFGQGFTSGAGYRDKLAKAQEESLGHCYQRYGSLEREYAQNIQSAEQRDKGSQDAMDRIIQNSRRQAELMMGT